MKLKKPTARYFISYARADTPLANRLLMKLTPLLQISKDYALTPWRDTGILPGEEWDTLIKDAADSCEIGLLLLTPSFLSRPYIIQEELPRLTAEGKIIIPVFLSQFDIQLVESQGLDALQVFSLPDGRGGGLAWSECRNSSKQDDFCNSLFDSLINRLKKDL